MPVVVQIKYHEKKKILIFYVFVNSYFPFYGNSKHKVDFTQVYKCQQHKTIEHVLQNRFHLMTADNSNRTLCIFNLYCLGCVQMYSAPNL